MIRNKTLLYFLLPACLLAFSCKKNVGEKESSVTFRTVNATAAQHLKGDVHKPMLDIVLNYQYATGFSDDSILKKIRETMLADFLPDLNDTAQQPETVLKDCIKEKLRRYESLADQYSDEDAESGTSSNPEAWKDHTRLLIRCNGKGLLSYTVESTLYTGGAHGGITFRHSLLDLKTGEKMEEEDLFNEASLPLINNLILKKLELQNKVETPEDLEQIGYFDVSQIGQYKNFYLSDQGLTYTFNEGEIGAYALGTIEVTLGFKDLEGFIQPESALNSLMH